MDEAVDELDAGDAAPEAASSRLAADAVPLSVEAGMEACWAVETGERAGEVDEADWAGEAGKWAGVLGDKEDRTGEAGVGAKRGPADRRGPACMGGTGTEAGTSIRSSSGADGDACCCMLDTEKWGAKGNQVSSKITWREMMMRRDSISMQR